MANLSLGLMLMVIGMLAVFIILSIVIFGSDLMIKIVNKIAPEEVVPVKKTENSDDPKTREIIAAAVAQLTGGKGKIISINKI